MSAAIRTTDFPDGPGTVMYDRVNAELDVENVPIEGLILAIRKVSGMEPTDGPQPTVSEFAVHNYYAGRV